MNIDKISGLGVNRGVDIEKEELRTSSASDSRMKTNRMGYSLDITGTVMENAAYGKEELKSAQDIAKDASMIDVSTQRNYMAVMSNSMSSEDFAKLIKDGVNPTNTSITESVTNLDKIKITMAQAGMTIEGFNDDLDAKDVEAVVGSASLANSIVDGDIKEQIATKLTDSDLPDSKDNIDAMAEAYTLASSLVPMTDSTMQYMLTNDLEPTIDNIYKAEHSSGLGYTNGATDVRFSGVATYANSKQTDAVWEELEPQAKEIVDESNIVNKEQGLEEAKWIVSHQVPLNKETLESYDELSRIELPAKKEDILDSMVAAIMDGKDPKDALLTETESMYDKAVKLAYDFATASDNGDITRRRQLEEIRLAMTVEANLTLMRKGITIDTSNLEGVVEKLKEAEREFYRPLLEDDNRLQTEARDVTNKPQMANVNDDELSGDAVEEKSRPVRSLDEKIDLYKQTRKTLDDIPSIPLRSIADVALSNDVTSGDNDFSLGRLENVGASLRTTYERANESYEALMTAPRRDMGDSISKAFANVDDILRDLDIDINDTNRKAVRTLGYAQMQITRESIESVREATMTVSRVLELMSPAKTLQMIREGHNPLNENIYELEKELSKEPIENTREKYSRFLWNLERKGEITENEKSAYIGMYRLFTQIEKQDGKVIGNVLSNGQELTMQNMLTASRSNKHKNMDVKIDDDYGVLEDLIAKGESISDQISKGFVQIITDSVDKEYVAEVKKDIKKAMRLEAEATDILAIIDEPVTVENILAVSDVMNSGIRGIGRLFKSKSEAEKDEEAYEDLPENVDGGLTDSDIEALVNDFTDRESAIEAFDKYIAKAIEVADNAIDKSTEYVDVKSLSMLHKQLNLSRGMARQESYEIPLKTEDGYTSIHLTIKHDKNAGGVVTASFETSKYGKVNAKMSLRDDELSSFIVSDSRAGVNELNASRDRLVSEYQKRGIETKEMSIVYGNMLSRGDDVPTGDAGATNKQLYDIAKTFIEVLSD